MFMRSAICKRVCFAAAHKISPNMAREHSGLQTSTAVVKIDVASTYAVAESKASDRAHPRYLRRFFPRFPHSRITCKRQKVRMPQ